MTTSHFESLVPSFTTPRIDQCVAFYRDLLGFECTSELAAENRTQWAELTNGPVVLMLLAEDDELRETVAERRG